MKCPVCKKNISQSALKCPYCKTRTGLLCSHCNTINPVGNLVCSNCGQELLKVCPKCGSVNFPGAIKCRKCSSPLSGTKKKNETKNVNTEALKYNPKSYGMIEAVDILLEGLNSKDKKIFSINGEKGIGKTTVLKTIINRKAEDNFKWCIGKCTQLTQLSPGGVVQDMLINLFNLPNFCIDSDEFKHDAIEFFSKEFKFLNASEISDLLNFVYNSQTANYEDIINNKRRTYSFLGKIFDAMAATGKFIFVVDNFDFIDGFSLEFFNHFMSKKQNWKNLKFIAIYCEPTPVHRFFTFDKYSPEAYLDVRIAPMSEDELGKNVCHREEIEQYVTKREREVIYSRSKGNLAFVEQALSYAFDCQISDSAFILPNDFSELIKLRLEILKKANNDAYKMLSGAAVIGDRWNIHLLKDIFGYDNKDFSEIINYLVQSNFIRQKDELYYEFNNLLLWENILKNITRNSEFDDINVKIGKALGTSTLNTNPIMAMIAHNLKENRVAFDIWTKTARLAAYVGDINLYVISQRQCLAILNEFNENETVNIRYSISEKLGKILSGYDPEEAMEFLPDAISNARETKNKVKEIELLSYLAYCCRKTGNYFGNVECVDSVVKELGDKPSLEKAMVLSAKLESLLNIGNCGEVINLVDNDILPILNENIIKPRLSKMFPTNIVFDTWVRAQLVLASALALEGNKRVFEVLKSLVKTINKNKINDKLLHQKLKLVQAYASTMEGDFVKSFRVLSEINDAEIEDEEISSRKNLIYLINRFMLKDYEGIQEELFEAVTFANNIGDSFTKNILKVLLGKVFRDNKQAQHALEIYNEQVTYFAKEKMALGALLSWYLIADATIITENSRSAIDVATQALEIAKNPNINNKFFIIKLQMVLAVANINLCDFETAKMHIESALSIAKKQGLNDLLSKIYLLYGKYYQDIGSVESPNRLEYLRGAAVMYEKALEVVISKTQSPYVKNAVEYQKDLLNKYCTENNYKL